MTTKLFAQPYDISANGFYFDSAEEYQAKSSNLRNHYGAPVEEFEIQFIDGEGIDCELFNTLSICQANISKFFEIVDTWERDEKIRVIISVGQVGYKFDLENANLKGKWIGIFKVIVGIFISPIMGLILGFGLTYIFTHFLKNKKQSAVNNFFKWMQLSSSACLSMAHGANDSQKTMGIITILLFSSSILESKFYVPFWVILTCYSMIALGTLTGGYRIMKTLGTKITKLNTLRGCGAETAAMVVIFSATGHGVPVSTTQTVTGAIAGVGLVQGLSGTCWPMLKLIFFSWFVTMPVTGGIAALLVWLIA